MKEESPGSQSNIQHGTRNIQYPNEVRIENSQMFITSLLDIPCSVLDIQLSPERSTFLLTESVLQCLSQSHWDQQSQNAFRPMAHHAVQFQWQYLML